MATGSKPPLTICTVSESPAVPSRTKARTPPVTEPGGSETYAFIPLAAAAAMTRALVRDVAPEVTRELVVLSMSGDTMSPGRPPFGAVVLGPLASEHPLHSAVTTTNAAEKTSALRTISTHLVSITGRPLIVNPAQ